METKIKTILSKIKNEKTVNDINTILFNKKNDKIIHQGSSFFYVDEQKNISKRMSGLLPVLCEYFWSNYDINKIVKSKRKGINKNIKKKEHRFSGIIRGTRVHEELKDYINCSKETFQELHPEIHSRSKNIIEFLHFYGWTPIYGEFDIYDLSLNIATSIDGIWIDQNGQIIIVDYKNVKGKYFSKGNDTMLGPLNGKLSNSPLNQSLLQVLFEIIFIKKNFNVDVEGYVIHSTFNGIKKPINVKNIVQKYALDCYDYVYNKRTDSIIIREKKEKRKREEEKKKNNKRKRIEEG